MRLRLVISLPLVAALAACSVTVSGSPVSGSVERLGPKGPVPAGLERFYGQALTWGDCRPLVHDNESRDAFGRRGVQCARLTVPLDYAQPEGRTASIGLLRRKASGDRLGALVINPGGPGVSGMVAAAAIGSRIDGDEVDRRFDLVGFDPRGIGASTPRIRCLTGQEADADRIEPGNTTVEAEEAENRDFAAKCAERSGGPEVLATVGTREVVRDMDVLRSALGEDKLTYLGYSYGTRIGTVYAETFPGNVRAMVLDGAVDPLEDPVRQSIGQVQGFEKALKAFFDWCAEGNSCAVKDRDALKSLVGGLRDAPADAGGGRKLSESDAVTAIAATLYDDQLRPILAKALAALAKGDGTMMMLIADTYFGRDDKGRYSGAMDALTAVRCVDEPRITDRANVEETTRKVREGTAGTFIADAEPLLPAMDVCAFWPVPNTLSPHQPQVAGLPKLLVVSTTGDPATPYQAGVNLAAALGAGLLTYEATQHTAFLQGDRCVDDAGTRYLVDLTLPPDGTRCAG